MNIDRMSSELAELEDWLARFPDPELPADCLTRMKRGVSCEVQEQWSGDWAAPMPSEALKHRVKAAVRQSLLDRPRPTRFYPWLAVAAVLALFMGISIFVNQLDRNIYEDTSFQLAWVADPELLELKADIAEFELRSYALDYLLSAGDEPGELQQEIERLSVPNYLMDFTDEPNPEGAL